MEQWNGTVEWNSKMELEYFPNLGKGQQDHKVTYLPQAALSLTLYPKKWRGGSVCQSHKVLKATKHEVFNCTMTL